MDPFTPLVGDPIVASKITKALGIIRRTLALYPKDKISFSFNGGKDSTVLLHLLRAAVHQGSNLDDCAGLGGVRSFYFLRDDDFQEVKEFISRKDEKYSLQVDYLTEPDFKKGLEDYISRTGVMAVVLGTRRGDPNALDQEFFCPSSEGWPPFMRVNPILDWTYHDVWVFLRTCNLAYCKLYDQGYTSLGAHHNTLPNAALKREDGSFAPAYLLSDWRLERAGRTSKTKTLERALSRDEVPASLSHSAAILVIGDEILAGKVEDVNSPFLCSELRALGWMVVKVVTVPDDVDSIASEVRSLSQAVELLITTGGIGPTLDDVTMEGVSRALDKALVRNPELESRLRSYFGANVTTAHLKMAEGPEGEVEVLDYALDTGEMSRFPIVRCRNIYILPGVPHLMRQKWGAIRALLSASCKAPPFRNKTFRLAVQDETEIADTLERISQRYGSDLHVGSYPVTGQEDGAGILVTLDSKQADTLEDAAADMHQQLQPGAIITVQEDVQALLGPRSVKSI